MPPMELANTPLVVGCSSKLYNATGKALDRGEA